MMRKTLLIATTAALLAASPMAHAQYWRRPYAVYAAPYAYAYPYAYAPVYRPWYPPRVAYVVPAYPPPIAYRAPPPRPARRIVHKAAARVPPVCLPATRPVERPTPAALPALRPPPRTDSFKLEQPGD